MNTPHTTPATDVEISEHLSDKNTLLISMMTIGAVLGLIGSLWALAQLINPKFNNNKELEQLQIVERLKPVAQFELVAATKEPRQGQAVYEGLCISCHGSGANGSPKLGDSAAWGGRIAQGYATLYKHAFEGFKGMPAKGGNPNLLDLELGRAIVFMANKAGASFAEPAAPKDGGDGKAMPNKAEKPQK